MSKVSIIIPNYNHTRFLTDSISSALSQTYLDREIIVVDDGSTDNCREVVEAFGEPVRYIYQENQGLAGARNTGIQAAIGDYIGLLDADDQWEPNYLENMIALAHIFSEAVAYYCQARCINESGEELPQLLGGPPVPPQELYWKLLRANFIIPSTTLIRRKPLIEAGLFDASLRSCEDWDLWLRLLPDAEIIGTGDCLVRYRVHSSSLSTDPRGMQTATQAVIEKHFGIDDGQPQTWTNAKRRGFGGVYRYYLLSTIQRQNDWQAGTKFLYQGFISDPSLSIDVNLFYDLALGTQPPGFRGASRALNLEANKENILRLLQAVFSSTTSQDVLIIKKRSYGTAYYALGLLAYNIGKRALSRKYLIKALIFRPDLWRDNLAIGDFLKSLIPNTIIDSAKSILSRF